MPMIGIGRMAAAPVPWTALPLSVLLGLAAPAGAAASEGEVHGDGHRHHVSLLIGGTTVPEADHTGVTYGIDYEYVLTHRFGVGVIVERAEGEIDATSVFAVTDIHLTPAFVLQLGPGVEFEGGEEIAVGRFGAYYEFDIGPITVAPTVSYDLSEKNDAVIYGILLGRKF